MAMVTGSAAALLAQETVGVGCSCKATADTTIMMAMPATRGMVRFMPSHVNHASQKGNGSRGFRRSVMSNRASVHARPFFALKFIFRFAQTHFEKRILQCLAQLLGG